MLDKENKISIDGNGNYSFQDINGSTITVNINNPEEIRLLLINFQNNLKELPNAILDKMKEHQDMKIELSVGANIYITILSAVDMNSGRKISTILSFQVTNLTKEIRYFGRPYFKTKPALSVTSKNNAFLMVESSNQEWPVRLEYGQVFNCEFPISNEFTELLRERLDIDNSTLQAFVTTTIGELYESNQMPIELFFRGE